VRTAAATLASIAAFAAAASVAGAQGEQPRTVNANGNAFTGGLAFDPAEVSVAVGDTVRWVNTDELVPHTATEDHGLWDLTGTYGGTPANPPGFGPGESRERAFEAGTHRYYCKVHPEEMRGTVSVPARLAVERVRVRSRRRSRRGRRRTVLRTRILATWAAAPPAEGLLFDVERRRAGGDWQPLATGTPAGSGRFAAGTRRTVWEVRARLRRADDATAATDWSPPARIRG
jgi:plastocyanin